MVAYCDGDCQRGHWKVHGPACKRMKQAGKSSLENNSHTCWEVMRNGQRWQTTENPFTKICNVEVLSCCEGRKASKRATRGILKRRGSGQQGQQQKRKQKKGVRWPKQLISKTEQTVAAICALLLYTTETVRGGLKRLHTLAVQGDQSALNKRDQLHAMAMYLYMKKGIHYIFRTPRKLLEHLARTPSEHVNYAYACLGNQLEATPTQAQAEAHGERNVENESCAFGTSSLSIVGIEEVRAEKKGEEGSVLAERNHIVASATPFSSQSKTQALDGHQADGRAIVAVVRTSKTNVRAEIKTSYNETREAKKDFKHPSDREIKAVKSISAEKGAMPVKMVIEQIHESKATRPSGSDKKPRKSKRKRRNHHSFGQFDSKLIGLRSSASSPSFPSDSKPRKKSRVSPEEKESAICRLSSYPSIFDAEIQIPKSSSMVLNSPLLSCCVKN